MSLSIKVVLIVAVLFPFNALARTPENMANELEQAAKLAVATLKTKGIYGLINIIEKCYSYPKKSNEQNFQCLYLDVAGRYLDQTAAETFNVPQKPFFQNDQFGARIVPVLGKANMDLNVANKYMENVTTVIIKMVDARTLTILKNNQTKPPSITNDKIELTYWGVVAQRVKSFWILPEMRKWDSNLLVQVVITINKDGEVVNIQFDQRSKDPLFDQFVEKTIHSAAPMPRFPALMQQETTEVGFRFRPSGLGN